MSMYGLLVDLRRAPRERKPHVRADIRRYLRRCASELTMALTWCALSLVVVALWSMCFCLWQAALGVVR